MATLVVFHAHPDDEAIATGGTMAMAADKGHRVVLVVATSGEVGEVAEGVLGPGESLGERRAAELVDAAAILGVARVEFLGYRDSGMRGTPANEDPASFWQADMDEAAGRLADLLRAEAADVLTIYDEHGVYGHPDHVQVHRVGIRAAEMAGVDRVYEASMNQDDFAALLRRAEEEGLMEQRSTTEGVDETMGLPACDLTHAVDVRQVLDRKRQAMAAHSSQITPESVFLKMPLEAFGAFFGTEWYRLRGAPGGTRKPWIL